MEERNDHAEKLDEVLLPGFRFHPTDEELVGFYLKRKIQQRPLSIELIKQLDIYKYDPWDLPSKTQICLGSYITLINTSLNLNSSLVKIYLSAFFLCKFRVSYILYNITKVMFGS